MASVGRREGVDQRVGLAAHLYGAVGVFHAHPRQAVEQLVGLGRAARIKIEAALQLENGVQAAAQVFLTAQTPAAGIVDTACHGAAVARRYRRVTGVQAVAVAYTEVGDTVNGGAVLAE